MPEIIGYVKFSQEQIDKINRLKTLEADVLTSLEDIYIGDGRGCALAKTSIEQAFMWAVRGIALEAKTRAE